MLANHQVFVLCDFVDYDVEGVGSKELVKSPGLFFVSFCVFIW